MAINCAKTQIKNIGKGRILIFPQEKTLCPRNKIPFMSLDDRLIFLFCPPVFFNLRIEMVVPPALNENNLFLTIKFLFIPFSTLFSNTTW